MLSSTFFDLQEDDREIVDKLDLQPISCCIYTAHPILIVSSSYSSRNDYILARSLCWFCVLISEVA